MEPPHVKSPYQATISASRCQGLIVEINSMIEIAKHGRLQLDFDQYSSLEAASQELAKIASSFAGEVKELVKRRKHTVILEGQKLLSHAESMKSELWATGKLRNKTTFIRNIQLFFRPPEESKLDNPPVRQRKKLTRERSERIRNLTPDGTITWAAAFIPSVWDSNHLSKSTFDFVVEFLDSHHPRRWPAQVYEVLDTLAAEQPLQDSPEFKNFLISVNRSAEDARREDQSVIQQTEPRSYGVPEVHGPAQEVIEMAFLVPPSRLDELLKLYPPSTSRHSIILTIPIEDRVATVVISIPREDAIRFGYESTLPVIFNSNPLSA
ncbi:hypothetical protein AFCA_011034 [Aspergillus flavus]|uniref:Uncharacterized protein n=1 Tax=Aspergillus flavus TaxID=5059 RepID=A0AB74CND8_ASPFL|nr:hypothetical protein COH21_012728 [Aspergillus flavus]RAQ77825.1 hypothetical protein COH20_012805 [Aspergillus flavus]RMZ47868.1 hypothetical protein CA14_012852 [Aspergillus flavus]UDD63774.1 hypothetical protein AFCA_011034 [Aspergillus flavus]